MHCSWPSLQHLLNWIGFLLLVCDSSNHVEWQTLVIEFMLLTATQFVKLLMIYHDVEHVQIY